MSSAGRPSPPTPFVTRVGIDENGLGPRLGPLVVTAVIARCTDVPDAKGRSVADRKARGDMRDRLADSKKLVGHGDTALGEAWARAIAKRMALAPAAQPHELVRDLSLDPEETLRAPYPSSHGAQCWDARDEGFTAEAKLVAQVGRDLDKLASLGVDVVSAHCVVTCTRRLNDGVSRGLTRFHMDLHAMERLALHARSRAPGDVIATCGKVGGFDRYAPAFGPMSGWLHAVAAEGRARSEYAIPQLGTIAFVRDADDKHLLVSMASLVGKWVRDLLMARIVRYHRADKPDLPDASGYHDPVTTRFVDATRLNRSRKGLPDDCFERRAWGNEPASGLRAPGSAKNRPKPQA